jgi:hypothetical protein
MHCAHAQIARQQSCLALARHARDAARNNAIQHASEARGMPDTEA